MKKISKISIPKGTIVQGKNGLVTLKADCYIPEAFREIDGCFSYLIGKNKYYVSAGCCIILK